MAAIASLTADDFKRSVSISAVCGVIIPVVESVPKLPYLAACADDGIPVVAAMVTHTDVAMVETKEARVVSCGDCGEVANNGAYKERERER
jgi:hypothetical protein